LVVGIAATFVAVNALEDFAHSMEGIGNGFGRLVESLEVGGTAANSAAYVASQHGEAPDMLGVSALNVALPKYKWVDGATNVPISSLKRPVVGISASGTHIVTAIQLSQGQCSYGVTIILEADPLIAQYHLPGPGTYWSMMPATSECIADQAPSSLWSALTPGS
jgi:hypothetical protein